MNRASLERSDIVFNNGTEISSLDPSAVSGVPEGRVMYALYEGLTVRHPKTLDPLPGMAESWELSEDGLTYTFRIRADARWNNGDQLNARDFEWSWQRLLLPETAAVYGYQLWYIEGARDFTQTPSDTAQDRWWFDEQSFVHWSAKRPDSLRLGWHRFGQRLRALRGEEQLGRDELKRLAREDFASELEASDAALWNPQLEGSDPLQDKLLADPYFEGWLWEVPLGSRSLEQATQSRMQAAKAREKLFWPQVGIKSLDDFTLQVKLNAPTPFFLELVSFYPTFPVHRKTLEACQAKYPDSWQVEWIRTGTIVTNGPYVITERRVNDRIRVRKSEHYWDRDNVAMQSIDILALESYGTMLNLYLTGGVDWIDKCAPNLIPRMLPREDFSPVPYLGSYFYRVNVNKPPLDDKRVRRALALCIDRRAVCEKITKKGELPNWALSPDNLPGYPRPSMSHAPLAADLSNYEESFCCRLRRGASANSRGGLWRGRQAFPRH